MALTERYVSDAGAGSADGTSEANAMSFATFVDYMVTGGSLTAAAGDRFNIKGVITSRTTTTDTFVNGGTATSPVIIRGYGTTPGDGYLGHTNGNGPLIVTNMPTITYTTGRMNVTGTFIILESLNITSAASNPTVTITSSDCAIRCKFTNSSTNSAGTAFSSATGVQSACLDCEINQTAASGGASAAIVVGAGARIIGCRIKSVSGVGLVTRSTTVVAFNTIFACGGGAIVMDTTSGSPTFLMNTIVGNTGDGINIVTGTTVLQCIIGNMFTDNTGDGIDMVSTANAALAAYNRTRDNANGYNNAGDWLTATKYGDVTTDTGGPETDYTNSGSNDYSLIAGSPATSAGLPAYASIGALQRSQTGGGGGGSVFGSIGGVIT